MPDIESAPKVVAWSFFGIGKSSEAQADMEKISVAPVLVAGLAGAVHFSDFNGKGI